MAVNKYKFKFNITHGLSASPVNDIELMSDTLLNAIKKLGTLYFRCVLKRVAKVMPDHTENEYPDLIGKSTHTYSGDNFDEIKKIIENSNTVKLKNGSYKFKTSKRK